MPTFPKYDISDDYAAHVARGSAEPGIDFKTPYGTIVGSPVSGKVVHASTSNTGGSGRRVIIAGEGGTWDILHLSDVVVHTGQSVKEGQQIGLSGASGFGKDWYYGPHVHISYWPREYHGLPPWSQAVDFGHMIGGTSAVANSKENEEMAIGFVSIQGKAGKRKGGIYAITPAIAGGKPNATFLGTDAKMDKNGLVHVRDETAISRLQGLIDGLR